MTDSVIGACEIVSGSVSLYGGGGYRVVYTQSGLYGDEG